MKKCVFCQEFFNNQSCILENDLAIAYYDGFPVSKGHLLIISKRHVETFFDLTPEEQQAIINLLNDGKKYLDDLYHPDGYNVGLNCGISAGQTVMHIHMHLIPRYHGDIPDPRGGIRAVIPSKKNY